MSYRIRRIDLFWKANPAVIIGSIIGVVLFLIGYTKNNLMLQGVGGAVVWIGATLAAKPTISAVVATMGFLGGLLTFIIAPGGEVSSQPLGWRFVSVLFFTVLYQTLMDWILIVVAALYNVYGGNLNLPQIHLDIEEGEDGAGDVPTT